MGGGQSNQAKANQNHQQAADKLKAEQEQQYPPGGQNMKNSKLQQQSNHSNLYDRNNQSAFQKNNLSSKVNSQNQPPQYLDTHNMPYQSFTKVSNQLKQTLKKIPKTGQCKVGVSILRITPNSRFPSFTTLEQTQSNYEGSWSWKFDEKEKKWSFGLEEPQSTGVQFVVNQLGQFIKGDPNQWMLLGQLLSPSQPFIDRKTHLEQTTDLIQQNNSTSNHSEAIQDLQANRKKLYKGFNEEYVDRSAQFPVANQTQTNNKQSFRDTHIHAIKKKFQTKSKEWLMTAQFLQNTSMFSSLIMWRADSKDKQQLISQLLEEERKLLQLRKEIYVRKMEAEKL